MNENMMNCDELSERISELLDDDMPAADLAAAQAHMSGCASCRQLHDDIASIARNAAQLPAIAPERDLWPEIAARIDAPVVELGAPGRAKSALRSQPFMWGGRSRMLAAAVMLVAATATITHLATRAWLPTATETTVVANDEAPDSGDEGERQGRISLQLASTQEVEVTYAAEIAALEALVNERRSEIAPATLEIVERNLAIIDAAIAECREALRAEPGSVFLARSLGGALDRKLSLLRAAATAPAGA
jgi:hypothetical protein